MSSEEINKIFVKKIGANTIEFSDFMKQNKSRLTGMLSGSRDRNRELVRIRDSHTCQLCGKEWIHGRRFDVHHIDEDNSKTRKPDNLITEWDNLITLCHACHLSLPGHRDKMKKIHSFKKLAVDNSF